MEALTKIIIEDALITERTNQRRLYSAAVARKDWLQAEKHMANINKINKSLKEDKNMTREEELKAMNGAQLIVEADRLGVKVNCYRPYNKLTEPKAKVVNRILEFEAAHPVEEKAEETPAPEKPKEKKKKTNLKIKELTYKGETKSIRDWAEQLEMPWPTLYDRVNRNGWTVEEALETPLGQRRPR